MLPGGSLLSVFGEQMAEGLAREVNRNRSTVLRLAEQAAGISREDLAERIAEQPQLVPLVVRVMYAAGMNGHDSTLLLLAGYLGSALADDDEIDDAELMISAIADLTERHIHVLALLEGPPWEAVGEEESEVSGWTTGVLLRATDLRPEVALTAARGLLRSGLVSDLGPGGQGPTYNDLKHGGSLLTITEMGRSVLEVLRVVKERESRGPATARSER